MSPKKMHGVDPLLSHCSLLLVRLLMSTYWYWVDGERKQNESESEQDETREAGQAAEQDKATVWRII